MATRVQVIKARLSINEKEETLMSSILNKIGCKDQSLFVVVVIVFFNASTAIPTTFCLFGGSSIMYESSDNRFPEFYELEPMVQKALFTF